MTNNDQLDFYSFVSMVSAFRVKKQTYEYQRCLLRQCAISPNIPNDSVSKQYGLHIVNWLRTRHEFSWLSLVYHKRKAILRIELKYKWGISF